MGTPPRPLSSIARLREWRSVRDRAATLDEAVRAQGENLTRRATEFERSSAAYLAVVPPELRPCGTPQRLARGTLVIACPNPAARHRLSRWLRSGGTRALAHNGIAGHRLILA